MQVIFVPVIICTFLSTLRICFAGLGNLPVDFTVRVISHDRWNVMLLVLLPWHLGSFARREISPIPWEAFATAMTRHGISDGIFSMMIVAIVDLWLFWIPAYSIKRGIPDITRGVLILIFAFNIILGLLLVTPENPIYKLIGLIPPSDPAGY
jgi:hypothetical protein